MFIGFLIALLLFAPLAYFLTRGVISHAHQSGRPVLGAFFLFLALLGGMSLLSFALLAAASMVGFSLTLGVEALVSGMTNAQPGLATAIGSLLIVFFNFMGVFAGPAGAFVAAKIMLIVALIAGLAKLDEAKSVTWLPLVAAVIAVWTMWPFTACLTLGL